MAKMTLMGLYNYDNTILDAYNTIDTDLIEPGELVKHILIQCGEFPILYTDPAFLKFAIANHVAIHEATWIKWLEVLNEEYNPLENYDRIEEWSDDGEHSKSDTESGTLSSQTNDNTNILDTKNNTTENKVSAFDSSVYVPKDQLTDTGSESTTNTTIGSRSDTTSNSLTESGEDHSTHSGRVHGNIGVTTSQQMLESELKLRRFNVYEQISNMFKHEFCLPIYI